MEAWEKELWVILTAHWWCEHSQEYTIEEINKLIREQRKQAQLELIDKILALYAEHKTLYCSTSCEEGHFVSDILNIKELL